MPRISITISEIQKLFLEEYKKQFNTSYSQLVKQLLTEFIVEFGQPKEKVGVPLAAYQTSSELTEKSTRALITPNREGTQPIPVIGHGLAIKNEVLDSPVFKKIREKGTKEDWDYSFKVGETPLPDIESPSFKKIEQGIEDDSNLENNKGR